MLCAAFNVPLGDRADAFWRAFYRLSLLEFTRMVDAAVAPESDFEKFPTVAQMWGVRKRFKATSTRNVPKGRQSALVEFVMRNFKLSDLQRAAPWNWITRQSPDPRKEDQERMSFEFLGVIVPQDAKLPDKHPAVRVMFADVDWQQHLEAT